MHLVISEAKHTEQEAIHPLHEPFATTNPSLHILHIVSFEHLIQFRGHGVHILV